LLFVGIISRIGEGAAGLEDLDSGLEGFKRRNLKLASENAGIHPKWQRPPCRSGCACGRKFAAPPWKLDQIRIASCGVAKKDKRQELQGRLGKV
jgi:hypothetical protein